MARGNIALVGDHSPDVIAHRAIPRALELACAHLGVGVRTEWIHTGDICEAARELDDAAGVWLVPASPYASMDGALAAIRFARETRRPFLGTCGGFQHALIEFARNVAGLPNADHAETNPSGSTLVVARLSRSLVEKTGDIFLSSASRLREIYDATRAHEGYHCGYGLNTAHRATLERAGMVFTAFDNAGEVRAAELPTAMHPFFVGTLFQPERAGLEGRMSPVVRAFVEAVVKS